MHVIVSSAELANLFFITELAEIFKDDDGCIWDPRAALKKKPLATSTQVGEGDANREQEAAETLSQMPSTSFFKPAPPPTQKEVERIVQQSKWSTICCWI